MITDSFDYSSPLFTPEDFYGPQQHMCDVCLITFSEEIYRNLLETYDCRKLSEFRLANGTRPVHAFTYGGMDIAFYLSDVGASCASADMIEANWRCGVTKFILFGSAGSLAPSVTEGRYVVPTEAYRDEGTSYHYAPPADYIRIRMSDRVRAFFEQEKLPYTAGRIWTTDAFYRETKRQAAARRDDGCIAVDMEIAGAEAVCDYHGFELYPFLVTGDILGEDAYDPSGLASANHDIGKLSAAIRLALFAGTAVGNRAG